MPYQKYDIVEANFNPKKGHVQAGIRPAIVISSNLFNGHSPTLILVPLTSQKKKIFPSEFIILASPVNGLTLESRFLGSQVTTVDASFVSRKIGILEPKYYDALEECISLALDLTRDF